MPIPSFIFMRSFNSQLGGGYVRSLVPKKGVEEMDFTPMGLALNENATKLIISDKRNHAVLVVDIPTGQVDQTITGSANTLYHVIGVGLVPTTRQIIVTMWGLPSLNIQPNVVVFRDYHNYSGEVAYTLTHREARLRQITGSPAVWDRPLDPVFAVAYTMTGQVSVRTGPIDDLDDMPCVRVYRCRDGHPITSVALFPFCRSPEVDRTEWGSSFFSKKNSVKPVGRHRLFSFSEL
jgi:hypothetical protein